MALRPRLHVLRPGIPVLARSPGVVQVGLSAPALCLPDAPEVRRLLDELAGRGCPSSPEDLPAAAAAALTRLLDTGLAIPATPARPDPAPAALIAQAGADARRRQQARMTTPVALDAPAGVRDILDPLASAAGLSLVAEEDARALLVVTDGPIARERLDPLVRASMPHLPVAGDATGVRIGPFVSPGRTACVRCVDAHESLRDERLPLLIAQAVAQYAERPPPRDPLLDHFALAWAIRDLVRFVEGDQPSTWSATVDLGPSRAPVLTRWGRHPYCGCAWDGFLDLP